jgi:undecaprenyl phosphate-alpha-L-ara4FN deformylase
VSTQVAFKVDVCNARALREGVPGLARLLDAAAAPAAFFVAFGPDNSGRAIRRLLRPGFAKKMLRTRAPQMYGFRTLLYGTLLPAPPVGESAPDLLQALERAGHEVGLHGFDHVGWHDGLARMSEASILDRQVRARSAFELTLKHAPRFSGAPAWQMNAASLRLQEQMHLDWASDTREGEPFYPMVGDARLATLQIPTTLPTSDELLGAGRTTAEGLAAWYRSQLVPDRLNVLGLHAEAEGLHLSAWFEAFLAGLRAESVEIVRLSEVAERERDRAPSQPVISRQIPGRVDPVASPASADEGVATRAASANGAAS